MPASDTLAYGFQLTTQMGDCLGAKAFSNAEDLVLDQGANGFRLAKESGTAHAADQSWIPLLDCLTHGHGQSSRGSMIVTTGSPSSPGPQTNFRLVSLASTLLPSRGPR
jgi:hypothetical protein